MSYLYERRYSNFNYPTKLINTNKNNNTIETKYDNYPKMSNINTQYQYYSTLNTIRKTPSIEKKPYNRPGFNYGNLSTTAKYKSVRKNGNEHLISNSYNIINNIPQNKNSQKNITTYNKRFISENEKINDLLKYENRIKEKEKLYFPIKEIGINKRKINDDFNNNEKNNSSNINHNYNNYQYLSQYNQLKSIKPTTAPINSVINNNNINTVIKSLESDSKKNNKIIKKNQNKIINNDENKNKNKEDNNINKNKEDNKKEEKYSDINLTEYYENNCPLVLNYTYKENANSNYRDYMEDKGRAIINLNGDENNSLFCLFDGHGGSEVSSYLQSNFANFFKKSLPFNSSEKLLFFTELFNEIDKNLKELSFSEMGSTAVIAYIKKEKNKKYIYCANIGDSRCVLIKSNEWKRLSYDDRASDKNEYERILKKGGIVLDGRINGQLMLSRAFGDWELKEYGVSSDPHVTKIEISNDDQFLVMASDGVWDVMDDSEVYKMSILATDSKYLCNSIMNGAVEKGSTDNISCFVIQLN